MRSYKDYFRMIGRKSVAGLKLRTEKKPGELELAWCAKARDYVAFRHPEAPVEAEVVQFIPQRRRA